jgi:chromosome segregation ATPase
MSYSLCSKIHQNEELILPICSKCGSYFSEASCTFCTPDDSPKSPVSTINVEEKSSVRLIDPIELLDSIEKTELDLVELDELKTAEIKELETEISTLQEKEKESLLNLESLKSQVSQLEASLKEKEEEKSGLTGDNQSLLEETNALKARILSLETNKATLNEEVNELKNTLGVDKSA